MQNLGVTRMNMNGNVPHSNDGEYNFDFRMGARYMTLTHSCNTPWAEAAQMEEGGSQFIPQRFYFIHQGGQAKNNDIRKVVKGSPSLVRGSSRR